MERAGSANGDSSPDTIVARSSSEEDRKRREGLEVASGGQAGGSNSSLDAQQQLPSQTMEKRKGPFGALRSSLKKEGLFKIKKKKIPVDEEIETRLEDDEKESRRKQPDAEDDSPKKMKRRKSLVRRISFNKFRLSSGERTDERHTPEGGDSSRSVSQSSQESPVRASASSPRIGKDAAVGRSSLEVDEGAGGEVDPKSDKSNDHQRAFATVTVVQRKSPSLTIRSSPSNDESRKSDQRETTSQPQREVVCTSTLPYAISKWPEAQAPDSSNDSNSRRTKLQVKYDSESSASSPKSSPNELRRKLSLLEEKRAIFQRKFFETTQDSDSGETVVDARNEDRPVAAARKKARHISVRKFDTFSTFDGTFDDETGVGYLGTVEENYTLDRATDDDFFSHTRASMGPMAGSSDNPSEKSRSSSVEQATRRGSVSSQNNGPNAGVSEKREHLYKILVIGELGAGKTSIIKRYVHQFFSQHYRATIGVDFALKVLNWDPHTIIRLQLWDIAGQERFGNMTRVYYKEAVGAFIVFDVTRSATLDAVVKWKQDLDSKVQLPDGSPIPCVLLANKCDQQKEGVVNTPAKMDEYCKEKNFAGWFETSAKENINIEEAARFLVNKILQNDQIMRGNGSQDQTDGERFALNQSPTGAKKSCAC